MANSTRTVQAATFALISSLAAGVSSADVVAIVSSASAITTLSPAQVTDIFLGKAHRFSDGAPAVPIDQSEGTALHDEFYTKFSGKSAAQIKAHWSKIIFTGRGEPPRRVSNSVEMKKLIAGNPAAIGYIDRAEVDGSVRVVTLTRP